MANDKTTTLQVIIASGPQVAGRALAGFGLALASATLGNRVVVWLTSDAAQWASPTIGNDVSASGSPSIAEHIALIQDSGGTVEVCPTCLGNECASPSSATATPNLRDGIQPVGMTTVAERTEHMTTVTF